MSGLQPNAAYTMSSAPLDGRWLWVYGVQLPMSEVPDADERPDWYRVRWEPQAFSDDGEFAPGYWDVGLDDMWLREPQAWMDIPPPPDKTQLADRSKQEPSAIRRVSQAERR